MFTRSVAGIIGTDRDVSGPGWKSRRLVLAEDGLPFSMHETIVEAGSELSFAYRSHSETVYCVQGNGSVQDVARGTTTQLEPGSLYSVGIGDEHVLRAGTEMTFLCVFAPPLLGRESAD
jgi:L-ectoine synthase